MGRSTTLCPGCRRARDVPQQPADNALGTPLSQAEPTLTPSISAILADRRGVLEHVPRGSRASVSMALARLLTNFCSLKTWESLRDLLGFAKAVLAAPKRGGVRRMPAVEREVIIRANVIGCSPFAEVWERSSLSGRAPPQRSKLPTTQQGQGLARVSIPEDQVSRICSLVAEGAISKACKHLLSTGLYDPTDPRVSRKLQDLHPQGPPPDISALGVDLDTLPALTGTCPPKAQPIGYKPFPQPSGASHRVQEVAPPVYGPPT
jgi:hypothetical protein